ncbi:hypothetical protein DL96DRAFT_1460829 [Flagelloscypha sp. PMI_526]|nr:hypothetical protein DL96DRAFT_1460829 [Flagelloscypha sp. PMI_526]
MEPDHIVQCIFKLYDSLAYKPNLGQFTVLAALVLCKANESPNIISLATGTKCLPASKYPICGEALHDSHAEVLARRGAIRWFLEEILRTRTSGQVSQWIDPAHDGVKWNLKPSVRVWLYVSTLPCGDASTLHIASLQAIHDPDMAGLKNASPPPALPNGAVSRGRNNYQLLSVLRTKPGRADSPLALSLSCSDKICRWNVLGLLGGLSCSLLDPVYIDEIIFGEVASNNWDKCALDAKRSLWERVDSIEDHLISPYRLSKPRIHFTNLAFKHSRNVIETTQTVSDVVSSSNESLCYVSKSEPRSCEILINGLKRGVAPKHRFRAKSRPIICKASLLELYHRTVMVVHVPTVESYFSHKGWSSETSGYGSARELLVGPNGPFAAWTKELRSGERWEEFWLNGDQIMPPEDKRDTYHAA